MTWLALLRINENVDRLTNVSNFEWISVWCVWQAEIAKINYEEGREEQLVTDKKRLTHEVQTLQEKLECLEAKYQLSVACVRWVS